MQGLATFTVRLALIGSVFALNRQARGQPMLRCQWASTHSARTRRSPTSARSSGSRLSWRLPAGIEIAVLRGDLGKGGGEILLKLPANYIVPNHSHISDEVYVWLKGAFTYTLRRRQRGRDWRAGLHQLAGQHAACAQVPFRGVHLLRPLWPTVRSSCP